MNESVSLMWDETFDLIVMGHSITLAQHFYRTLVFSVGMVANYMVVMVTSISRQFRHQPRHIFWAAISLFEFIFIVNSILESITVQYHDELACRFWIVLYPVDGNALMLCHFLATIDRYLSIVRYEWYKDKVTNRRVVGLISFAFVVSFVVITSPFWTGYKSIYNCTINLTHLLIVQTWNFLLALVCVTLHFKIFYETKTLVQYYLPKYYRRRASVKFIEFPPANKTISGI
jgi:hypothetical protein